MTKKMLWYVALGLLCCGLGATVFSTNRVPSSYFGLKNPPSATKIQTAAPKYNPAASMTATSNVQTPEQAAQAISDLDALYARMERGEQLTPAEKAIISANPRYQDYSGRDNLDASGGPDGSNYRFVDNTGGDTATFAWIELCGDGSATNGPSGDDAYSSVPLSFSFPFYGSNYTTVWAHTNGYISLIDQGFSDYDNTCIGIEDLNRIAPYWDDMLLTTAGGCGNTGAGPWVRYRDFGTYLVVEWSNAPHYNAGVPTADRYSYQAILFNNGRIKFQYNTGWNDAATPNSATIGIDAIGATNGLEYRCQAAGASQITAGRAIWFYTQAAATNDFRCAGGTAPAGRQDPGAVLSVSFNAQNAGSATQASPVKYRFNGGPIQTETTASLSNLQTENHVFATQITVPVAPGFYTLKVWTDLTTDTDRTNDTCTVTIESRQCIPTCTGIAENETPCASETDAFNGGCNACPEAFFNLTLPAEVCGTFGTTATSFRDTDFYRFTIATPKTITVTLNADTNAVVQLLSGPCGSLLALNTASSTTACSTLTFTSSCLTAGTYTVFVSANYFAPAPCQDYRLVVTATDCTPPTCLVDQTLTAPGSISGTTGGDDCSLRSGVDATIAVTIPSAGLWRFSLCATTPSWDSYLFLSSSCCGTALASNDDSPCGVLSEFELSLAAGTYYVDVEPFSTGSTTPQPYTLDVTLLGAACDVVCQGGDIAEIAENVNCTNADGDANGGCNSVVESYQNVSCGQTICGRVFTYINLGGQYRDTDWYQISLADSDSLQIAVNAEVACFVVLVEGGCAGTFTTLGTTTPDCVADTFATQCLGAGTYTVIIVPTVFTGIATPAEYRMTINCIPCGTVCEDITDLRVLTYRRTNNVVNVADSLALFWSSDSGLVDSLHIWSADGVYPTTVPPAAPWTLVATIEKGDSVTSLAGVVTRRYVDARPLSALPGTGPKVRHYNVTRFYCFTPPPPPPPLAAERCPGTALTGALPITVTNTTAGTADDYDCVGLGATAPACWQTGTYYNETLDGLAPDVAYDWTAPSTGTYTFSTGGSTYDTVLLLYNYTCPTEPVNPTNFLCGNDDDPTLAPSSVVPSLSLTAGQRVLIIVDGWNGNNGQYTLTISTP